MNACKKIQSHDHWMYTFFSICPCFVDQMEEISEKTKDYWKVEEIMHTKSGTEGKIYLKISFSIRKLKKMYIQRSMDEIKWED